MNHSEAWEAWQADVHRRRDANIDALRAAEEEGYRTAQEFYRHSAGTSASERHMNHDFQHAAFIATLAFLLTLAALYLHHLL